MNEGLIDRNLQFVDRIRRRFNIDPAASNVDYGLDKSEIFRRLVSGRGKGKPHCSNRYPRHEGEIKGS